MKLIIIFLFVSLSLGCFTACQNEINQLILPTQNEVLIANADVTILIKNTVTNDGSKDNIIDNSSCSSIKLPVNVLINGTTITVNNEEDYHLIETIFDDSDDDSDSLQIIFPIVIILSDFSEIAINNYEELNNYRETCNESSGEDDKIECIDFVYPIKLSIFNSDSQLAQTVTVENDEDFYKFIDDIEDTQIIEIHFPISVILQDKMEIVINDMTTLENVIKDAKTNCDD